MNRKKIYALIPARGGSKSVPLKNIKILHGKPLIVHSIESAKMTKDISRIFVSTDHDQISSISKSAGAEIINRPESLSGDFSLVKDTVIHAIDSIRKGGDEFDIMILLEPTCPFRSSIDIQICIDLLIEKNLDTVATFSEALIHPERTWRIENNEPKTYIPDANPWLPRQKLSDAYQLNGAVYAFRVQEMVNSIEKGFLFGKKGAIIMPPERSIDINTEMDFFVADSMKI